MDFALRFYEKRLWESARERKVKAAPTGDSRERLGYRSVDIREKEDISRMTLGISFSPGDNGWALEL
jgi:hypothetical protein